MGRHVDRQTKWNWLKSVQSRLSSFLWTNIRQPAIQSANSNCYLYACDEYDESLHVYKADDVDFHLKIKRDILPNIIKVFDFIETEQGELKSLSLKDDEFIIDQAYET